MRKRRVDNAWRCPNETVEITRGVERDVAELIRGLGLPGMANSRNDVSDVLTTALSAIVDKDVLSPASMPVALGAAVACGIRIAMLVTTDRDAPRSGVLAELMRLSADVERDALSVAS